MASNRRRISRTTVNYLIDGGVFVAFLAATSPALTGLAIHEWLSIAVAAVVVTHLLLHWSWIVGVTGRLFGKVAWDARVNYALNVLLFVSFTTLIFTGLLISEVALPALGLDLGPGRQWVRLHRLASDASVILLGLHVALHWRWIMNVTRRLFRRPAAAPQPQEVSL